MADYRTKSGRSIYLWTEEAIVIRDDLVEGPSGPIGRTLVKIGNHYEIYTVSTPWGGSSYTSATSLHNAFTLQDRHTRTFRQCQLWDVVPGLQWKDEKAWDEAYFTWMENQAWGI